MNWKTIHAGIDYARRVGNGAAVIVLAAEELQALIDAGQAQPIGETTGHRLATVTPGPHLGEGGEALARQNTVLLAQQPEKSAGPKAGP